MLFRSTHITRIEELFGIAFDDGTASWWLDGSEWTQRTQNDDGTAKLDLQDYLINQMGQRRAVER